MRRNKNQRMNTKNLFNPTSNGLTHILKTSKKPILVDIIYCILKRSNFPNTSIIPVNVLATAPNCKIEIIAAK